MRRGDLIAGLSIAGLLLPEAVAYAGIAGLPPQRAILAAIAGCLVYWIFGRSRFAFVSPTSSAAAILAATLTAIPGDDATRAAAATVVVALTAIFFLLAAAARLGWLAGFISRPVLSGFVFGLSVTIVIRQMPILVGFPVHAPDIFHVVAELLAALPRWNPASVAVGAAALIALLLLRRFPAIPGAFLVLAAGIAASTMLRLPEQGIAVVGPINALPAWPTWPSLAWPDYVLLAELALPLVLILFAESWGSIRPLALRHGETVQADRELAALGLTNAASALVQGMPVGAGFSAAAAGEAAGARTRATAVVAGLGLVILVAIAGPLVAQLPEPVLAAVVIATLARSLDPSPLVRLWRLGRDQYVALGAAAAVLILGILHGMLIAIALSLAALVQRLATPQVARLGRLGTTHNFVDLTRHPDATAPPGMTIWRPTQPLFFANAEPMLALIAEGSRATSPAHAIVVSLEESSDLDSTALDALIEFDTSMRTGGRLVQYARVHDRVQDLLAAAGAGDFRARSSYSVDDAVRAVEPLGGSSEEPR